MRDARQPGAVRGAAECFQGGIGKADTADLIARAAQVRGMDAADLNYPDHFDGSSPEELSRVLAANGMALNGLAMRYYTEPGFRLGAFTNRTRGCGGRPST